MARRHPLRITAYARPVLLAAMAFCLLLLSGCGLVGGDLTNQLRPPRGTGEQEQVQQALEDFIYSREGRKVNYTLKYPKNGEYRSAFIMEDMDGDGTEEAFAFYRIGSNSEITHVCYLRKQEGEWVAVADREGFSSDIYQVKVAELQRNGLRTLCVGWQHYNSQEKEMLLYTPDVEEGLSVRDVGTYAAAVVEDLTDSGYDDILLLSAGSTDRVNTAQLWSIQNSAQVYPENTVAPLDNMLVLRDSAPVDGYIQSYGVPQVVTLPNTYNGVFIDGYKDGGAMVTELLYWNGQNLVSPFYDAKQNSAVLTERYSGVPSMDIDGDGMVEWPQSQRMNGYNEVGAQQSMWTTDWYSWEFETGTARREFSSIYMGADSYCLRLDETLLSSITASYSTVDRTLSLMPYVNNEAQDVVLMVRVSGAADSSSGVEPGFREVAVANGIHYSVWFDNSWFSQNSQFNITTESLQYLLMPLT